MFHHQDTFIRTVYLHVKISSKSCFLEIYSNILYHCYSWCLSTGLRQTGTCCAVSSPLLISRVKVKPTEKTYTKWVNWGQYVVFKSGCTHVVLCCRYAFLLFQLGECVQCTENYILASVKCCSIRFSGPGQVTIFMHIAPYYDIE